MTRLPMRKAIRTLRAAAGAAHPGLMCRRRLGGDGGRDGDHVDRIGGMTRVAPVEPFAAGVASVRYRTDLPIEQAHK
jgi:hypothetical protein